MQQDVMKVQQLFWDALKTKNNHDLEQVLAADFVSLSPDEPPQFRAEFIAVLTTFPGKVVDVDADDLRVNQLGEVAVLTGVQTAQIELPNGAIIQDRIALTNVFRLDENDWRMVLARPVQVPTR
jgi:ketosteroid isomerase-like protein